MMTIFDYVVLFIFITSIIISTMRGLLKEILSLASWVIAFFVANAYGVALSEFIPLVGTSTRLVTAFAMLFLGTRLLMGLLSMAIDSIVKASGLKLMDRGLGSLFGAARAAVLVLSLMLIGGMTTLPYQPFWKHALFRPMLETSALTLKPFLPGAVARHVNF